MVQVLAEIVAGVAERCLDRGLVLTGGDVAAGGDRRLGAEAIVLGGEVRPAIPWGVLQSPMIPGCRVVTKAGSFGDPEALLACVTFLQGE